VARLAGLPDSIIDRAKAILEKLEAGEVASGLIQERVSGGPAKKKVTRKSKEKPDSDDEKEVESQLSLFG
jgi:DNA mismatch repair ATPase MutS